MKITEAIGRISSAAQTFIEGEDDEISVERTHVLNLREKVKDIAFIDNSADLAILYEITGYQADKPEDQNFWINYESYKQSVWNSQMTINRTHSEAFSLDSQNTLLARAPDND